MEKKWKLVKSQHISLTSLYLTLIHKACPFGSFPIATLSYLALGSILLSVNPPFDYDGDLVSQAFDCTYTFLFAYCQVTGFFVYVIFIMENFKYI